MTQTIETRAARQVEIIKEILADRENHKRDEVSSTGWVALFIHYANAIRGLGLRTGMQHLASLAVLALEWETGAMSDDEALESIQAERQRQDEQWGGSAHDDQHVVADWVSYVVHQIGRLSTAGIADAAQKIAALAVAAIESHDRRHGLPASLRA